MWGDLWVGPVWIRPQYEGIHDVQSARHILLGDWIELVPCLGTEIVCNHLFWLGSGHATDSFGATAADERGKAGGHGDKTYSTVLGVSLGPRCKGRLVNGPDPPLNLMSSVGVQCQVPHS